MHLLDKFQLTKVTELEMETHINHSHTENALLAMEVTVFGRTIDSFLASSKCIIAI